MASLISEDRAATARYFTEPQRWSDRILLARVSGG
jgi:hypothetical protein